jgi:hypothetical protein
MSGFSSGILSAFYLFSYTFRLRSSKKEFFFSGTRQWGQSAGFQNHLDFGLAKHLDQFGKQRVRSLFGGQDRPRCFSHGARRGV